MELLVVLGLMPFSWLNTVVQKLQVFAARLIWKWLSHLEQIRLLIILKQLY